MTDPNPFHQFGIEAHQDSDRQLWRVCFAASKLVGNYEPKATLRFAEDAGRSVSTISKWSKAWKFYLRMRKRGMPIDARYQLNVTFFVKAAELVGSDVVEYDEATAYEDLMDIAYHTTGVSAESYDNLVRERNGSRYGSPRLGRIVQSMRKEIEKGESETLCAFLSFVVDVLDQYMTKGVMEWGG